MTIKTTARTVTVAPTSTATMVPAMRTCMSSGYPLRSRAIPPTMATATAPAAATGGASASAFRSACHKCFCNSHNRNYNYVQLTVETMSPVQILRTIVQYHNMKHEKDGHHICYYLHTL